MNETPLEAFRRVVKENADETKSALKLRELTKIRIAQIRTLLDEPNIDEQRSADLQWILYDHTKLLEDSEK